MLRDMSEGNCKQLQFSRGCDKIKKGISIKCGVNRKWYTEVNNMEKVKIPACVGKNII